MNNVVRRIGSTNFGSPSMALESYASDPVRSPLPLRQGNVAVAKAEF